MIFHVTDLDSVLWYNKIESMTAEDLRKRLLRLEPPAEKMLIGTAWHNFLEHAKDGDIWECIEVYDYTFRVDLDLDIEIPIPEIKEIRAKKDYFVDGQKITLTGKCDGIDGSIITDWKLTFRENIETYFDSYQWRSYLDIFNADVFRYWIFSAKEKDGAIIIHNVSEMRMYRYPGMEKDIEIGIRDLLEFVRGFVPEKLQ